MPEGIKEEGGNMSEGESSKTSEDGYIEQSFEVKVYSTKVYSKYATRWSVTKEFSPVCAGSSIDSAFPPVPLLKNTCEKYGGPTGSVCITIDLSEMTYFGTPVR